MQTITCAILTYHVLVNMRMLCAQTFIGFTQYYDLGEQKYDGPSYEVLNIWNTTC